mmetsp:Transcript_18666/g.41101  ORF Transcript_18666/g.41101 Transcript_18666/m.41101 type:complete len:91 (+) Transcript_18666:68-340(+)
MTKLSILACLLVVTANAVNVPTTKAETSMAAVHKGIVLDNTVGLMDKDDGGPKIKGLGNVGKNKKSAASARTLSQAVALLAASAALAQQF